MPRFYSKMDAADPRCPHFVPMGEVDKTPWSRPRMALVQDNERKLLEPYAYVRSLPGKNVRGQLIGAFQKWIGAPAAALDVIHRVVDELHNASLMCVLLVRQLTQRRPRGDVWGTLGPPDEDAGAIMRRG